MRLRPGKQPLQQPASPQRRSRAQQQPQITAIPSHQEPAQPPSLLSLPHELLCEVFKHLEPAGRKALFLTSRTIASISFVIEQAHLKIDFLEMPRPTLRSLQLLDRHTRIRCLTLSGTHGTDLSCVFDFLRKSLGGSNERLLLQGVVELRLKGWRIGEDACTTLGALISELCPNVRTLHLEDLECCSTLFRSLAQVQELYIRRCFRLDPVGGAYHQRSFAEAVLPLRLLHTLCLDVNLFGFSAVTLLPELRHLQLGHWYVSDLLHLQNCPKLEIVTFLDGDLSLFNSRTVRKIVCFHCSHLHGALSPTACHLSELYKEGIENVSLPALETLELDRAYLSRGYIDPQVSAARLNHFLGAVSPRVSLDIRKLIIGAAFNDIMESEVLCILEALAGRFQVRHLDCRDQLSDSGLQQLASLMPSGMQRVVLALGSMNAACLAGVVLGWRKLDVLELVGAYEDSNVVWALSVAVQRCLERQRPLQVVFQLNSRPTNISDLFLVNQNKCEWKERWMARWEQEVMCIASGGRIKVQLCVE